MRSSRGLKFAGFSLILTHSDHAYVSKQTLNRRTQKLRGEAYSRFVFSVLFSNIFFVSRFDML